MWRVGVAAQSVSGQHMNTFIYSINKSINQSVSPYQWIRLVRWVWLLRFHWMHVRCVPAPVQICSIVLVLFWKLSGCHVVVSVCDFLSALCWPEPDRTRIWWNRGVSVSSRYLWFSCSDVYLQTDNLHTHTHTHTFSLLALVLREMCSRTSSPCFLKILQVQRLLFWSFVLKSQVSLRPLSPVSLLSLALQKSPLTFMLIFLL